MTAAPAATRTHRDAIAAIPPATRAALNERRDGPGALRLGAQLSAIGALGTAIVAGVPGWPILLLPQGVLLVFLFCCLHEVSHETVFTAPRANRAAAWLAGLATLLPPTWFRYFHLAHHRYTQDPERDPELAEPLPRTARGFLWRLSGVPLWIGNLRTLGAHALGGDPGAFVPARARARVRGEARVMICVYTALVALAPQTTLWAWAIPSLLGQPFLRAYLMAEHGRCAFVADMLQNTRTTFTNRAVRWLAWNMPYHVEHHSLPAVPFHRLPQLHALMRDDLRVTAPGYVALHRGWLRDA